MFRRKIWWKERRKNVWLNYLGCFQGRQFGPDGNLAEWWAPKTKTQYLERAECIIKQYGNYSFPELDGLKVHAWHF